MKALVVYDSQFGNTERIARAIGEALGETHDVNLSKASDVNLDQLGDLNLLVVGSPTQRFNPTLGTTEFLKRIPAQSLQGVRVAAFDTRLTVEEIEAVRVLAFFVRIFGYAAKPIANRLRKKGGELALQPEGFYVKGMEGPLVEGELERAHDWARRIAVRS
jgi:flavodoxin I